MKTLESWFFKKFRNESWEKFNWPIDRNRSIEESCFVVFDTETTGLDLKEDEALSIGALKIHNLRLDLSSAFYTLLKPSKSFTDSIKVHGITPGELKEGVSREQACRDFLSYSRGCILAGYFVHIDIAMIQKLVKQECGGRFYPHSLDLVDMLSYGSDVPTLEQLLKSLNLPLSNLHNALEDAYMTAIALLKILREHPYRKAGDLPLKIH